MEKKKETLWEIMFVIWALGVSVIAVLLAIGLSLADFFMKTLGRTDAQGGASKARRNKYYLHE
jgi:lauroyl/myristoyl acyltransferase